MTISAEEPVIDSFSSPQVKYNAMRHFLIAIAAAGLLFFAGRAAADPATQPSATQPAALPPLDGPSGKGLEMRCSLIQSRFGVGEDVNIWCTVTNTTESVKPIGWHPRGGSYFCLVKGDTIKFEGLLPLVIPQMRESLLIKANPGRPGNIIYLPARQSIVLLLTYKAHRPEKFRGRVVYDPLSPRDGWIVASKDEGPPWKSEWSYSPVFEYEVKAAAETQPAKQPATQPATRAAATALR